MISAEDKALFEKWYPAFDRTHRKKIFHVGKSGKKYPYDEYWNWGTGKERDGKKDLPADDYPYVVELGAVNYPQWMYAY